MNKKNMLILIIIVLLIAIILIKFSDKDEENDLIFDSNLVINTSPLISEEKFVGDITFTNCKISAVNNKTVVKVTLGNSSNKLVKTKKITFQLLDLNNDVLSEEIKENIILAKKDSRILKIYFEKPYENVHNIRYIVE